MEKQPLLVKANQKFCMMCKNNLVRTPVFRVNTVNGKESLLASASQTHKVTLYIGLLKPKPKQEDVNSCVSYWAAVTWLDLEI